MQTLEKYQQSSIGKKQIVATTGLMLILFLVGHLAGNLFFYLGPEAFNAYAEKLAHMRPGLYLVEFGLFVIFLIHILLTASIVIENRTARKTQYASSKTKVPRSLSTKIMPFTGSILLIFVIIHLFDFTFANKSGPLSVLADGHDYGLYGVVYNTFRNPVHSAFYIVAMMCLGFHLFHGIQSFVQTFGFYHPRYTPMLKTMGHIAALAVAFGFSSIPVYVLLQP